MLRLLKLALSCSLVVYCLQRESRSQVADDSQPAKTVDAAYRKLDDLLSSLRARNAEQFAIKSAKGVDEASFISIAER